MISKILALSKSSVPGRFEGTIGSETRLVLRPRFLSSSPRREAPVPLPIVLRLQLCLCLDDTEDQECRW